MEPSRKTGQPQASTSRQHCAAGRSCPNLRRADTLDEWITQVASERNAYREALEQIRAMSDYEARDGAPRELEVIARAQQTARLALERLPTQPVHHHRALDSNGHSEINGEDAVEEGRTW